MNWGLYLLIFVVKVFEVSLSTTRIVLITKGERRTGAIIGFFEVVIWIILASTVLTGISEDPFKVIVYALGFSVGNYVGSMLETKLGIGTTRIEAILNAETDKGVLETIREEGFAATELDAHGSVGDKHVIIMHVKRKNADRVVNLIKSNASDACITINEIKAVYGGFGILRK